MKELIELRIKDLIAKGKELEQQLHQINGALQQCEWTLNQLKEEENAIRNSWREPERACY